MGDADIKSPAPMEVDNNGDISDKMIHSGLDYLEKNDIIVPKVFDVRDESIHMLDGSKKYDLIFLGKVFQDYLFDSTCKDIDFLLTNVKNSLNPGGIAIIESDTSISDYSASLLRGYGFVTHDRCVLEDTENFYGMSICIIFYPR